MPVELVPASSLDTAARAALFTAAYEGYVLPFRIDEATLAFMEHAFDLEPEASLLARVDGELVGLANLGLRGADAWVGGVGVVPAHRGTGAGETLMLGLVDAARARGVERLWLEVIVENTVALRLYEKLGFEHVRDVEVWSLAGEHGADAGSLSGELEDAHTWIRAHRAGREPWQRADATVERLAELEPAPQGVVVDGGAAIVRLADGRATIVQLAGDAQPLLETVRGLARPSSLLNLPADDPAAGAFRELGAEIVVRQHEMVLGLAP